MWPMNCSALCRSKKDRVLFRNILLAFWWAFSYIVHIMVETGSLLKKYKNRVLWNENTSMRTFSDTYIIWYVDYLRYFNYVPIGRLVSCDNYSERYVETQNPRF
jgi:hypothetical protein